MNTVVVLVKVTHFLVCIGLIVIVLLQADKGEGLAGAFGGGASSTVFGERGGGGFITKLTTGLAVVFMITSLVLSIWVPRWERDLGAVDLSSPRPAVPMNVPLSGMPMGLPVPGGDAPVALPAPVVPVAPVPPDAPAAPLPEAVPGGQ